MEYVTGTHMIFSPEKRCNGGRMNQVADYGNINPSVGAN
jgi:hypothetical protein